MTHHKNKGNAKKRFVQMEKECILDSAKDYVHQFESLDYKIDTNGRLIGEFDVDGMDGVKHSIPFSGFNGDMVERTMFEYNEKTYEVERICVLHSNN